MSDQRVPLRYVIENVVGQFVYWYIPGSKRLIHWDPPKTRAAGFNPEVDARRELTIRMKLSRGIKFTKHGKIIGGQHYIPRTDGWFLLDLLDKERRTIKSLEDQLREERNRYV